MPNNKAHISVVAGSGYQVYRGRTLIADCKSVSGATNLVDLINGALAALAHFRKCNECDDIAAKSGSEARRLLHRGLYPKERKVRDHDAQI